MHQKHWSGSEAQRQRCAGTYGACGTNHCLVREAHWPVVGVARVWQLEHGRPGRTKLHAAHTCRVNRAQQLRWCVSTNTCHLRRPNGSYLELRHSEPDQGRSRRERQVSGIAQLPVSRGGVSAVLVVVAEVASGWH